MLRIVFSAGVILATAPLHAGEWFAAPSGTSAGLGTRDSPWDLESALDGRQKVAPGDTVWILRGTYRHPDRETGSLGYTVRLAGEESRPVHIRAEAGQRVTIDGGLTVREPAAHVWIRDLEILTSENFTLPRRIKEPGSHPKSYNRPHGGLNIYGGKGCLYINLVIHDNAQGVSFWSGATDSELYGSIIYDNGWDAPDRGHGHAIYTQNEKGIKKISDCILTGGHGYTMHAYGSSRAFVDHYAVEGNICYDGGTFLIGGGRPSRDIRVLRNYLYNVPMRLGYSAPHNEDCEVRENVIVNGALSVHNFKQVIDEGNRVIRKNDPRPTDSAARVVIRPNRYDPDRFHVVIFNWARNPSVDLDPGEHLKVGDRYRLLDPRDVFGAPVTEGTHDGRPLAVPVKGEFAAFVLVRS